MRGRAGVAGPLTAEVATGEARPPGGPDHVPGLGGDLLTQELTSPDGRKGSLLLVLVGTLLSSQEVVVECYFLYEGDQPTEIPPPPHRPFLQITVPPSNSENPPALPCTAPHAHAFTCRHTHLHTHTHRPAHAHMPTHRKGRVQSRVHDPLAVSSTVVGLFALNCGSGSASPAGFWGHRALCPPGLGHSAPGLWLLFPATPC